MRRVGLFLVGILLSISLSGIFPTDSSVQAQDARQIAWDDLLPQEQADFDDPFAELTEEQLFNLALIAQYRDRNQKELEYDVRGIDAEGEAKLTAALEAEGIDVDWLLSQRKRVAKARRQQAESGAGLDGEIIKLPGYALPLSQAPDTLTEFLLVPWVGACIHVPPPPPNQMVHVSFPEGAAPRDRYAPVWIEGRIEHELDTYELFLVDGSRFVRAAYRVSATAVTEYTPTESDPLSQVALSDQAMAGQSFWQRWQTRVSVLFTNTMADIKGQPFSKAMALGLLAAFLYGLVHTLGPGHGKSVIVSYFVGEGVSLSRGLWMGLRIAVLHVLAAVALVVLTDAVVRQVGGSAAGNFRIMRLISYGSIAVIGAWMLWRTLQPMGDTSAKYASPAKQEIAAADAVIYGDLTQQVWEREKVTSLPHQTGWNCRCLSCLDGSSVGRWLSVAIGAVPCSGALIVMLYGLANNLLGASIAMVVAISLGMAVALSAIGMLAIWGRQTLDRQMEKSGRGKNAAAVLQVAGAAIVFLLGSGLFVFTALQIA